MRKYTRKFGIILFLSTLVLTGVFALPGNTENAPPTNLGGEPFIKFVPKEINNDISIGFVGDITPVMVGDLDYGFQPSKDILHILNSADIMIGNLEGAITDRTVSKCKVGMNKCYAFRGNTGFATQLKNAGFDVMNMANNHAFDFGNDGFIDTQYSLQNENILSTGAQGQISFYKTKNTTVALVGFAPNHATNSLLDSVNIQKLVSDAKSQSDIVVAIIHGGGEGTNYTRTKNEEEIFLGENRGNVMKQAHLMIDSGADLVLGSGPHVLRGFEIYKGKMIAYSLGNFFASNNLSTKGIMKFSGILNVDLDKQGTLKRARFIPAYIGPDGTPYIDYEKTAINMVNTLSKEDFGENALLVEDDGVVHVGGNVE